MSLSKALIALSAFLALLQLSTSKSLNVPEEEKYKQLIEGKGLYSPADDVEILIANDFKQRVFMQKTAWFIEFYNSWCGFCQRFAPTWKALATDTKPWKSMVKVGAIDCSDDENSPLCREFEIMSYPTLKYFHEFYEAGTGEDVKKGSDLEQQKSYLLDEMIKDQQKGRGEQFPNLQPSSHPDLDSLRQAVIPTARFLFLLVGADGLIGPQLALDFASVPAIAFYYTNANNKALISVLKPPQLPALFAVRAGSNRHEFPTHLKTREEFRQAIVHYVDPFIQIKFEDNSGLFHSKWMDSDIPDMNTLLQAREKHAIREKIERLGDAVFQVDLETALKKSLKNEIGAHGEISGEKLEALRQYVNVLRKYFPIRRNGQIFLNSLFQLVHSNNIIHGHEIAQLVTQNENRMVLSSHHEWMGCQGSSSGRRGFPCGMWKLFHYLTVQASDHPLEVLSAINNYVKYFFGCTDCSQHFQEMARVRNLYGVETLDEAILWLWRAHNEVNDRIKGDETEDPEYPKVQFPSAENCPQCRDADGTFNSRAVLNYLKNMYSRERIQYLGSDESLSQNVGEQTEKNHQRRSIIRRFDTSMCFIIYFISFVIFLTLIRLFLKRGYRKKMYAHDILGKV